MPGVTFVEAGIGDEGALTRPFGCEAVAHCAGINREIGSQTYDRVHVEGTANVVRAATAAGAARLVLLSFLRARPDCGSPTTSRSGRRRSSSGPPIGTGPSSSPG